MKIIGYDIGGANIKASFIQNEKLISNYIKYFPMWTSEINQLSIVINEIKKQITNNDKLDAIAITMTAELSDAFYTKREGILQITNSLKQVFHNDLDNLYFINIYGNFIKIEEVFKNPLSIAAANWVATSKYVGKMYKNCILIDIGSTTTDIIPILNNSPTIYGKNDTDRLLSGELVYTGVLRTEIPSITHEVPYKNQFCRISSEKFALSADIHLVLEHINESDYKSDTADNRAKNRKDSLARIARIICADLEMLSENEIIDIAKYIYSKQIDQIYAALKQIITLMDYPNVLKLPIIVTGLGSDFLAKIVASKVGFDNIINLNQILGHEGGIVAPSAAIAFLLEENIKEE